MSALDKIIRNKEQYIQSIEELLKDLTENELIFVSEFLRQIFVKG